MKKILNNMKKSTIISSLFGFYLGYILTALFGVGLSDWRWWIVILPSILLSTWAGNEQSKEN
jgi:hypothetical protein